MAIWDERYLGEDYAFGVEPNIFLHEIANNLPTTGTALDLATGEGRNAVFLAQRGLATTGIDVSQVGLNKAKKLADNLGVNVRFILDDILTMDWTSFDVISSVFFHLPKPTRFEIGKKIVEALTPNGFFVGVFYHSDQLKLGTGGPSQQALLGTLEDWQSAFDGLTWRHAEHRTHVLQEGNRHCGLSSVVYLLGQKIV